MVGRARGWREDVEGINAMGLIWLLCCADCRAVCAVDQMKAVLRDLLRGRELILPFHGIGHFRNEVAFVELAQGEHLATLAQITGGCYC